MKRLLFGILTLAVAAVSPAQQPEPAPQPTPAAGQSGLSPSTSNVSGMQISTGTVTEYTPGEKITIRVSKDEEVKLDLDKNVHVDGHVAVGLLAAVMWNSDGGGKRRVTSITAAPGSGDSGLATLESGYQQMSAPKSPVAPAPTGPPTTRARAPRATATPAAPRMTPTPTPIP